jgi:hypothetical protein
MSLDVDLELKTLVEKKKTAVAHLSWSTSLFFTASHSLLKGRRDLQHVVMDGDEGSCKAMLVKK